MADRFDTTGEESLGHNLGSHRVDPQETADAVDTVDGLTEDGAAGNCKNSRSLSGGTVMQRLLDSGLFDAEFYRAHYSDVAQAGIDPLDHYIKFGAREARAPSAGFDTKAYLATYPEAAGGNPLLHYLVTRDRLLGSGLFDAEFYKMHYSDVAVTGADPLDHYIKFGAREARDPSASFDAKAYLATYPEAAGGNPLLHYLEARDRVLGSGFFDAEFYKMHYSDVAETGIDPLDHYIKFGAAEARDPSASFDTKAYLATYPKAAGGNPLLHYSETRDRLIDSGMFDVEFYKTHYPDIAAAGIDPLGHYINFGAREARDPSARFDAMAYLATYPEAAGGNPVLHYLETRDRVLDSGFFDAEFYETHYFDIADAGIDLLDHYIKVGAGEALDPSADFDTKAYLATYPEVAGGNALLHYLEVGSKDKRSGQAVRSFAPGARKISWAEWEGLADRIKILSEREPEIDVIVPIYRGLDETANCLFTAVSSRLMSKTPIEVVVIDDCCPEPELVDLLDRLSLLGLFSLLRNENNLGFVATVNRGMLLHPGRDVVLLNSDTEVYSDWIDRLRDASNASPAIGTVTPFSNNATICSYPQIGRDFRFEFETPFVEIDRLAREVNRGQVVDIPTAVGFCMYIRRQCLNDVGLFDVESFGHGYGEENDFCFRNAARGWRNVLAGDVFVRHLGRRSFGGSARGRQRRATAVVKRLHPSYFETIGSFVRCDPLKPLRRNIDIARLRRVGERAIMMVSHGIGGGLEKHVFDLCGLLEKVGITSYILKPLPNDLVEITHSRIQDIPNLGRIDLKHGLVDAARLLRELGVFHMHIHSLFCYSPISLHFLPTLCRELAISYDFTAHDYVPLCPRVEMIDASGVFCDKGALADCEVCIRANGSPHGDVSVGAWRAEYQRMLQGARRVFAPDDDVRLRLQRLMPGFEITVRPHPEAMPDVRGLPLPRAAGEPLRVALIGTINPHKGARQLKLCAEDAIRRQLPITYVVFGRGEAELSGLPNVEIIGQYRREDLQSLLAGRPCHLAFIPTVTPETYCYILSEALFAGLFPVAFDLGAQARRIRAYGWGMLLPFTFVHEPGKINDALLACEVPPIPDYLPVTDADSYQDILTEYYQFNLDAIPSRAADAHTPLEIEPGPGLQTEHSHAIETTGVPRDAAVAARPARLSKWETVASEFDVEFYLASNPDVAALQVEPIQHYIDIGWREQRDPAPWFSIKHYLADNSDVREAGLEPFYHYLQFGRAEARYPSRKRVHHHRPLVSVVVPNYNHAEFLAERLESILRQTYDNTEILVLDDASMDNSREIIERYQKLHPSKVRALYNHENSGSVFSQWRLGTQQARGELIWICESDDSCEPDFLENLIGYFIDPSIMLAFGRIQFVDAAGAVSHELDDYRESAKPGIWDGIHIAPTFEWFRGCFGIRNIIPNVGGCIFRRQSLPSHIWEEALNYRVLGDWFLYAHLGGGGRIAYDPRAISYFRQHLANTSSQSFSTEQYYVEHFWIAKLLRERFGTPDEVLVRFDKILGDLYADVFGVDRRQEIRQLVDLERLLLTQQVNKHILIAIYGFITGGAEVLAINLANQLNSLGYIVSVLCVVSDCAENQGIRAMLDTAIAVYKRDLVEEMGPERFLKLAGVDLVNSHTIEAEYLFFAENRGRLDVPYVATLHGAYELYQQEDEPVADADLLAFLRGVDYWIYLTQKNLGHLQDLPIAKERTILLPNAVAINNAPFAYTRADIGADADTMIFGIASRALPQKGWQESIDALRIAQRRTSRRLMLLLCGDNGPELKRLEPLHRSDPDIKLLGFQPNIHGFYRLCDCCLLPTSYGGESFPLTIIQSLQVGTPVIATDVGEIRSMIEPAGKSAGIVIQLAEQHGSFVNALAGAMIEMSDDVLRAAKKVDAAAIGARYDLADLAHRYLSVFAKAANWTELL